MAKVDSVQAYYLNQDEITEKPCQVMTRDEARLAKKEKKGWFISNGTKFRFYVKVPLVGSAQYRQRPTVNSCCGISKNEMQANAGVVSDTLGADFAIMRAQQKIAAYPHTYDKAAVLARGSWNREVAHV